MGLQATRAAGISVPVRGAIVDSDAARNHLDLMSPEPDADLARANATPGVLGPLQFQVHV